VFELNCVTGIKNPCTVDFTFSPQTAGFHNEAFSITAGLTNGGFVQSSARGCPYGESDSPSAL